MPVPCEASDASERDALVCAGCGALVVSISREWGLCEGCDRRRAANAMAAAATLPVPDDGQGPEGGPGVGSERQVAQAGFKARRFCSCGVKLFEASGDACGRCLSEQAERANLYHRRSIDAEKVSDEMTCMESDMEPRDAGQDYEQALRIFEVALSRETLSQRILLAVKRKVLARRLRRELGAIELAWQAQAENSELDPSTVAECKGMVDQTLVVLIQSMHEVLR